ncbi:unnamed protein product [Choristocarpus tenellus]
MVRFWIAAATIGILLQRLFYLLWHRQNTPTLQGFHALSTIETVVVNGHEHTLVIRGHDISKSPILLCLHGGPGASEIPFIHQANNELERRFIVVTYDQRSAGKSCKFYDGSELTVRGHVDDAIAVAEVLLARFQHQKLYIKGGSWGSVLALLFAQRRPDIVHKVLVRGMLVDGERNEQLSREFTLNRLRELGVTAGVKALEMMRLPPYQDRVSDLVQQRKWLYVAGGMSHSSACPRMGLVWRTTIAVLLSPEMSLAEAVQFERCLTDTLRQMWPEVEQFKATEMVPELEVPLVVFHGRHDHCTSAELVEGYLNELIAPAGKSIVWFEGSGHSPQLEEPMRFQQEAIKHLLEK